jgi:hypothetical protein
MHIPDLHNPARFVLEDGVRGLVWPAIADFQIGYHKDSQLSHKKHAPSLSLTLQYGQFPLEILLI